MNVRNFSKLLHNLGTLSILLKMLRRKNSCARAFLCNSNVQKMNDQQCQLMKKERMQEKQGYKNKTNVFRVMLNSRSASNSKFFYFLMCSCGPSHCHKGSRPVLWTAGDKDCWDFCPSGSSQRSGLIVGDQMSFCLRPHSWYPAHMPMGW